MKQLRLASISSSKCVGKSCEFGWLHDLAQESDQQHLTSENTLIPSSSRHSHERGRPHHFEQEHAHPIHYGGQRTVRYPILVHTTAPEHQVQEASMRRRAWPGAGARRSAQNRDFGTAVNRSGENDRIPGFEGFRRDKATGPSTFTAPTGLGPWGQAMAAYGTPTFPSNPEAEEMLQPSGMGARRDSPGGPENLAVPREIPVEPSGAAQVPAEDRIPSLIGNSRALSNNLSAARPIVTVAGNVVSPENLVSEGRIAALSVSEARARGHDYISAGDAAGIERTRQIPPLRASPSPSATQMERTTASTPDTGTALAPTPRTGDYATAAASRAVSERGYTSAVGLTPVSLGSLLTAVAGAAPAVANAGAASAISTTVSAAEVRKDLPDAILGESMVATGRARDTAHDVAVSRVRGTNALESSGASLRSGRESAAMVIPVTVASRQGTGTDSRISKRIDRIYNPASPVYGGRMKFRNQ